MRAVSVLVAILSLAAPQVSWTAIDVASAAAGAMSMSATPVAGTQLVRSDVKTDKTFGSTFAITQDAQALFAPEYSVDGHSLGSDHSPNFDLHGPPLAPRPPPLQAQQA